MQQTVPSTPWANPPLAPPICCGRTPSQAHPKVREFHSLGVGAQKEEVQGVVEQSNSRRYEWRGSWISRKRREIWADPRTYLQRFQCILFSVWKELEATCPVGCGPGSQRPARSHHHYQHFRANEKYLSLSGAK